MQENVWGFESCIFLAHQFNEGGFKECNVLNSKMKRLSNQNLLLKSVQSFSLLAVVDYFVTKQCRFFGESEYIFIYFKISLGTVDRNPPASAEDTGSTPGLGRFHTTLSNQSHVLQPLRPYAATTEAHVPRACTLQQEKPLKCESHAEEQLPLASTRESLCTATKTQCSQK